MIRRLLLGTLAILGAVALALHGCDLFRGGEMGAGDKPPGAAPALPTAVAPLSMPGNLVDLLVTVGLKDSEPTRWQGRVQVSEGHVLGIEVLQGGRNRKVEGERFTVRTVGQGRRAQNRQRRVTPAIVRVKLDAPVAARLTIATQAGDVTAPIGELPLGGARTFLEGAVRVERLDGALRLTGPSTEDDFPVLAQGAGGSIWLVHVEYQPGPPLEEDRVLAGEFDLLVPEGNGDRILLRRFDGKTWHPPRSVTAGGLDIWRPAVTVDGRGNVCIFWSQKVDGDWELFSRRYTPGEEGADGKWSAVARLTRAAGSDFQVAAATDSAGKVWLAWQAWRGGGFDILVATADEQGLHERANLIPESAANEWNPAIAADSKGTVYVAWDSYEKESYVVRLQVIGAQPKTLTVAGSARFEARPHLACDARGRLWIAYEEGDEQWGKDYSTNQFSRIGFEGNPGFALYVNRTVRVKCLVDGALHQPAGDLEAAWKGKLGRAKSQPRLGIDASGGLWLLVRHHILPGGRGEAWRSFALRYHGDQWSAPRRLSTSSNLLDNRPALVSHGPGMLVVHSSDHRVRTQSRGQDDLYASFLNAGGLAAEPKLAPDEPPPEARLAAVHPNERADVKRLRDFRLEIGGKTLRLLRGEFHRHTEYTAHRDQDGTLEDSWRYALDAGRLDWMGNGDHDNGFGHEYMWWQVQKISDLFHNPPHFVAALTYERSNVYPNGHRNVMFPRRGIRPLPRGDLKTSSFATGTPDTKLLYAYLKHFDSICSSHTSGTNMGTDWRDNDPLVEPVVEIYQGHRHNYEHFGAPRSAIQETHIGGYRPAGFVWNALKRGYRLGFQSSSDHVSTHMSYAVVFTEDVSRQAILDSFKRRHCYAATDNILLVVRSGDHLMGDVFETKTAPTLTVEARGTGPIARVNVVRDNIYVYTQKPGKSEVSFTYTDHDAKPGEMSYYYVRVEQADGNLAWASPLWIAHIP